MKRTLVAQRLALLASCGIMTVLWLVAWMYNIVVSTQDFLAGKTRFHAETPLAWYEYAAIDQTTASTFMLVITFAVPLLIWVHAKLFPDRALPRWLVGGYTTAFYRFVLYLGLAATLAGMVVALLAVAFDKTDTDAALAQLVAGSATALVSSLIALVAAFFGYALQLGMRRTAILPDPELKSWDAEVNRLVSGFGHLRNGLLGLLQPLRELKATMAQLVAQFGSVGKLFAEVRHFVRKGAAENAEIKACLAGIREEQRQVIKLLSDQVAAQRELIKIQSEQFTGLREAVNTQGSPLVRLATELAGYTKTLVALADRENDATESERLANQRAAHAYSATIVPSGRNNGHRTVGLPV